MTAQPDILAALRLGSATPTVNGAFERFLNAEINISRAIRSNASTRHLHIRGFLGGESSRDATFPRILSQADDDFLGGSFARHSKNWPLDDIDIYFPLDGHNLTYFHGGIAAPYAVLSDDVAHRNPLLDYPNRWMNGAYVSSQKLIDQFANVLRRHYPTETRVRRAGAAVNVKLSDDLGFDVVPCFSLLPSDRDADHIYLIPNGSNGWIETNPRIDNEVSAHLQAKNNEVFRPAVKLVKWWNTERFNACFSSYYVELALMRRFLRNNRAGQFASTLSDAVATGFEALGDAAALGNQPSWLPTGPAIEPGTTVTFDVLNAVAGCARTAASAEQSGRSHLALQFWKVIFGDKFPT